MINGVTQLIMSKGDVLANPHFDVIKVATHYILKDGTKTNEMPENLYDVQDIVYMECNAWPDIRGLDNEEDIPIELAVYYQKIEDYLGIPIKIISTGPDRTEILFLD